MAFISPTSLASNLNAYVLAKKKDQMEEAMRSWNIFQVFEFEQREKNIASRQKFALFIHLKKISKI